MERDGEHFLANYGILIKYILEDIVFNADLEEEAGRKGLGVPFAYSSKVLKQEMAD